MDSNTVIRQMQEVFKFLMSLFYIGAGVFFIFYADILQIDKALRNIVGIAFLLYGIYRFYASFVALYKLFFRNDEEKE